MQLWEWTRLEINILNVVYIVVYIGWGELWAVTMSFTWRWNPLVLLLDFDHDERQWAAIFCWTSGRREEDMLPLGWPPDLRVWPLDWPPDLPVWPLDWPPDPPVWRGMEEMSSGGSRPPRSSCQPSYTVTAATASSQSGTLTGRRRGRTGRTGRTEAGADREHLWLTSDGPTSCQTADSPGPLQSLSPPGRCYCQH